MMRMMMIWDITEFCVEWLKEEKIVISMYRNKIWITFNYMNCWKTTKSALATSIIVHGPNKPNYLSYRNKC